MKTYAYRFVILMSLAAISCGGRITDVCDTAVPVGSSCTDRHCAEGSYCKEGVCATNLIDGDACENQDYNANCINGDDLYCDTTAMICRSTLADGESCTFDEQCTSWNCDSFSSVCTMPVYQHPTLEERICQPG